MNNIVGRKIKLFKANKVKLSIFLILPFLLESIFFIKGVNLDNIIIFTPYIFASISALIIFTVKDLMVLDIISKGAMDLKSVWLTNTALSMATAYIYSEISLLIFTLVLKIMGQIISINYISISISLIFSLFTVGMILLSTIYLSDYSKINQFTAAFFELIIFSSPFLVLLYGEKIDMYNYPIIILAASTLMITVAFIMFGEGNVEILIIKSQDFIKTYNNDNKILRE